MKRYECIRKCFYRNRLWVPGEILELSAGKEAPGHFELREGEGEVKPKPKPEEPKTFHGIQHAQAKEVLKNGKPEEPQQKKAA